MLEECLESVTNTTSYSIPVRTLLEICFTSHIIILIQGFTFKDLSFVPGSQKDKRNMDIVHLILTKVKTQNTM